MNWKSFAFVTDSTVVNSIFESISYISFACGRCCLYLTVFATCCTAALTAASQPLIDFDKSSTLLTAASKIRVTNEKVLGNLQFCQESFPHLLESAEHARQVWHTRNEAILQHATSVSKYVINNIKQDSSAFVAEKMVLDMDLSVSQEVEQFLHNFRNKGRKEQHYLCNRLILSISDGEHDLERQNSTETRQLLDFNP